MLWIRPEAPKSPTPSTPWVFLTGMNSSLSPFPHLHKNSHSLLMNRMGNRSSWKSKDPHPHSNTKKALPARLLLGLCCAQTEQSAEFCLKQPSLGMQHSLRLHLETIFPPSLFPSLSLQCALVPLCSTTNSFTSTEQGPLLCPGLGRAGAAAKEKSLQLLPTNQVNASSLPRPSCVLCYSPNIYVFVKHINISSEVSYSQHFMWSFCFHAPKPSSIWLIHTRGLLDLPYQSHRAPEPNQRSKPQNPIPRSTSRQGKDRKWWQKLLHCCVFPTCSWRFLFLFFLLFSPLTPSKSVCLWTFQKEQKHRSSLGSSCKSAGECKFSHSLHVNSVGKRQFGVSSTNY